MEHQNSLAKEIELLIKKTSEANNIIASETAKFIYRLAHSQIDPADLASIQQKLLINSINNFIRLNIQYTSNLIDTSVEISKSINENFSPALNSNDVEYNGTGNVSMAPEQKLAFELKTSTNAGGIANTAFLLHNDKTQPVKCTIVHSAFVNDDGETLSSAKVVFTPQAFELNYGKAQKIDVQIIVSNNAKNGVYRSHVTVHGFEHTHFDILLAVMPSINEENNAALEPVIRAKKTITKSKASRKIKSKPKP